MYLLSPAPQPPDWESGIGMLERSHGLANSQPIGLDSIPVFVLTLNFEVPLELLACVVAFSVLSLCGSHRQIPFLRGQRRQYAAPPFLRPKLLYHFIEFFSFLKYPVARFFFLFFVSVLRHITSFYPSRWVNSPDNNKTALQGTLGV